MNKISFVCFTVLSLLTDKVLSINAAQNILIQSKFLAGGLECIKEYPLSIDEVKTLRSKMLPEGDKAKCFAACLFKKIGIMDDMGNLSQMGALENAKNVFSDDHHLKNVEEFIGMCSSVNEEAVTDGEKGCDRAKLAFGCLAKNAPKYGFNLNF